MSAEFEVGQWIRFTHLDGHVIDARCTNKVVKGKHRNTIEYTFEQWPLPGLGYAALDQEEDMYHRHQFPDKQIHIVTLLHDDGTKSTIRVEPHLDGISLRVYLGEGKVLHDLEIERDKTGLGMADA